MPSTRTSRRTVGARRTSTSSRSTSRSTSRTSGTPGWGSTSRSTGTRSTSSRSTGSRSAGFSLGISSGSSSGSSSGTGYAPIKQQFEEKIQSFRQLKAQIDGRATGSRPTPTTLTRWANFVNQGAVVFQVSGARLCRATNADQQFTTATSACRALQGKFGKTTIKGVIQSKTGQWLVAAEPRCSDGRPFRFPA